SALWVVLGAILGSPCPHGDITRAAIFHSPTDMRSGGNGHGQRTSVDSPNPSPTLRICSIFASSRQLAPKASVFPEFVAAGVAWSVFGNSQGADAGPTEIINFGRCL